jgi:hypothetical protein
VTTMDAAAARRLHPKVAVAVLMAWAGLGLAGCETGASLFGQTNNVATQQPVAPQQPELVPMFCITKQHPSAPTYSKEKTQVKLQTCPLPKETAT